MNTINVPTLVKAVISGLLLAASGSQWACAASGSAEDANKSNNPLNFGYTLNVQDYYTPSIYNSDKQTNDLLLRAAIPIPSNDLIGVPQLMRATMPVAVTRPQMEGGYSTGIGDINVFDIFLLKTKGVQLGVGPLVSAPTASDHAFGTGKWQAGLAAVVVKLDPRYIAAGLLQWQQSFAGDSERADMNTVTFQPALMYNLPKGFYLRSTATWTFDVEKGEYYIPVGLGMGKVIKANSGDVFNFYLEPQFTLFHDGEQKPQFTLYGGFNITFK
ncbi:hypothetical protein [Nissabacter sp. SGAir0207]|uniref:hypothetical protein n=1 Tax=Nissabacter sp. SGAir0207 TaxID=2126321 RepID=UPI0010CCB4ED|nr:hypothetical protein [Nissabacter sp. SGAir0207]QCR35918.1 hypothetical protein C1N62_07390 [Nissabacter sp. SGAir0207]